MIPGEEPFIRYWEQRVTSRWLLCSTSFSVQVSTHLLTQKYSYTIMQMPVKTVFNDFRLSTVFSLNSCYLPWEFPWQTARKQPWFNKKAVVTCF